jgi:uncharacterized membrane protein
MRFGATADHRICAMDTIIVAVFSTERDSYAGSSALRALHDEGSIALYAMAVIAKNANGQLEVKQAAERGPAGTTVGLLTGSLLGLLAGPAGFVITATAGLLGGAFYDLGRAGISERYLADVGAELGPNRFAVVAEVWEEWTTPVDQKLGAVGGIVFRTQRGAVIDDQIQRDVDATRRELDQLDHEVQESKGEEKARLQDKVDATRAKLRATKERADAQVTSLEAETSAKIEVLRTKAGQASSKRKAKLEAQMSALQVDLTTRGAKLKTAAKLASEALL